MRRLLRLFTWHTLELLAIGALGGVSVYTILKVKELDEKLSSTELLPIIVDELKDAVEYLLYESVELSEAREHCNNLDETKYILANFRKDLDSCECFGKSVNYTEPTEPQGSQLHEPEPNQTKKSHKSHRSSRSSSNRLRA